MTLENATTQQALQTQIRAVAERFFTAIEQADIETVRDCYARDAVIWHNIDDKEKSRDENIVALKAMVGRIHDRRYEQRRLHVFESGFVQQHVLKGTRTFDGRAVALTACIVCEVLDGKITRLDEYLDSPQVAEFRKQAGA
ncbi:nuclear transport factor 2 family protein (plasmid) [Diaphorobacter sp. HDW4B]|uniref:nuclear transport factor 2 family protein n=1 Tax=Diaphorobacter sp. HDW4B TaxID=2714925 RepID=UPI001407BE7A|nr:nuclear transport factor 2 family protein [Diaphorobacter sp. HDW4B]QIL74204.1 nuclear transport factor 2 family protein [Diaphorobacter sp. HDW4B]